MRFVICWRHEHKVFGSTITEESVCSGDMEADAILTKSGDDVTTSRFLGVNTRQVPVSRIAVQRRPFVI